MSLSRIHGAAQTVVEQADDVSLDPARLSEYAGELPVEAISPPAFEHQPYFLGEGDETVAYLVTLATIDFGSGYFPWTQPRDGATDHAMVAESLTEQFERHGPFAAEELVELTAERCGELFAQEIQHDVRRKLMASYAHTLGELGEFLLEHHNGRYVDLVESADGSAARLVEHLGEIPSFRDEVVYRNQNVPFYRRAQMLAHRLDRAFDGRGPGAFEDIDKLALSTDSRVAHVLRLDGLLDYSDQLAERIDAREPLPSGSPEEIEIRACALQAVDRLAEALADQEHETSARSIHDVLWQRGGQDRYRVRPAHLTRSVFY